MTKQNLILLGSLPLLLSCDSRLEDIGSLNAPPEISILTEDGSVSELADSVRLLSPGSGNFYNLRIAMDDPDNNLHRCRVLLDSMRIGVYYDGKPLRTPTLRTDQATLPLSLLPKRTGRTEVVFELTDKFGSKSTAKLDLYAFENLAPEAVLRYSKLGEHEVELDASGSYDTDHRHGGRITSYHFAIDGISFETPRPNIRHIFFQKGSHAVTLKVRDNNGAFSKATELRIEI